MISGVSLKHGAEYYFRIHRAKSKYLLVDELKKLHYFIFDVLKSCPNDYFFEGPRSSVLKTAISVKLEKVEHEVKFFARMGLDSNYYGNAHLNVQMFMLAYDKRTVAIEVPIWISSDELEFYETIFNSTKPLSGHIDVVRVEDDCIWIWDYKPNAHREKFACTQTFFYALMLSIRTGIPLERFRCGYFDDKNVYCFKPSLDILENFQI